MTLIPKHSPHRDRKLLDLAHRLDECMNCGEYSAHGLEPAHSNWSVHGKGMSMKADDWAHAALCRRCHDWLDSGHGLDPTLRWEGPDKQRMWESAYWETVRAYWTRGWVRVA